MALIKHKSVSVSHVHGDRAKKDERVIRSRKQIDAAFVELLHRRAYGNIRVSDIAKKAGVGRATFYAHYPSKDHLLRSQFDRFVAPMLAIRRNQDCPNDDWPNEDCPLDATAFFTHIQMTPRFFRALIGGPDTGTGPRVLQDCFEERVRQALDAPDDSRSSRAEDPALATEQAIVTRVVASSLLAVVEGWMESNLSGSPQEVQAIFSKLVGGGLKTLRAAHP
ncbi:MAG TPA: TetR/AcrR family transcriptional regulator [Terriglobales bacterium]|nr:TetR/AcrR family transcriptional regulator [Terriglobales bacterium]